MPRRNPPRPARETGRDSNGRFKPGFSGNPHGRPPREPEEPKLLDELLAVKLLEKVTVTGADGKTRKVSAHELIVDSLIESLATAKPREKLQILEGMEKRGLFHKMKLVADEHYPNPFDDEHETWLEKRLMVAEAEAMSRRSKRPAKEVP